MKGDCPTSFLLDNETKRRINILSSVLNLKKRKVIELSVEALTLKCESDGVLKIDGDTKTLLTRELEKSFRRGIKKKQDREVRRVFG